MMSFAAKSTETVLDDAYAPNAALFARVAAPIPELDIALQVIAEQRARIDSLENEVMTDSMTGMLNKRGFIKALTRELELANRYKKADTLLVLFDLDGLKAINDQQGHLAGDAYINAFAAELQNSVRATDYVARVGGDEFALLMTDGNPVMMQIRLEDIISQLNAASCRVGDQKLTLSVSHGSVLVAPDSNIHELVSIADGKMYSCKAERKISQRKVS